MADGQRSTAELAEELDGLLGEARRLVAACPPERWGATTSEGWTVPAIAHHVTMHALLVRWAAAIAQGADSFFAGLTPAGLDQMNADAAKEYATKPREATLEEIDSRRASEVAALRKLTAADLEKSQLAAYTGGAPMSARNVIEDLLLGALTQHVEHLRAAVEG